MGNKQNRIQNYKKISYIYIYILCKYFKIYIHVNAIA